MQIEHIAGAALDRIFGRILRRGLLLIMFAIFALVALYQFTSAGTISLEIRFGAIQAQLIVAGVYTAFALVSLAIWWGLARKTQIASAPAVTVPREMQMAMLVEAVMLGYSLAKKGERTR
ncbi:MAG: hypothetical protein WAM62_10700 [Pseudolabrys sp.]